MSLLQQDAQKQIDDAARGEEYTKGSSHLVLASIVAAILVTAAIAAIMILGRKPPAATGDIEQVWIHPQHTDSKGFDANGAPMPVEHYDQIYVFALIKLHNQSNLPLFLRNASVNTTLPDGISSSYAATAVDYDRVFIAYKDMPVPHGPALSLQSTLSPGQTEEGTIVSAFKMSKQEWDAGKNLNFTIGIQYQPDLVLTPHTAPIVQ
jgi:hypothetical protein